MTESLLPTRANPLDSPEGAELSGQEHLAESLASYLGHWVDENMTYLQANYFATQGINILLAAQVGFQMFDQTARRPEFKGSNDGMRYLERVVKAIIKDPDTCGLTEDPSVRQISNFLLICESTLMAYLDYRRPKPEPETLRQVVAFWSLYQRVCREEFAEIPIDPDAT